MPTTAVSALRILIIPHGVTPNATWEAMVRRALGDDLAIQWAELRSIQSDEDVLSVLGAAYDLIVVPLTLPNYMSVRLVEFAHNLQSNSRILLCSGTDLDTSTVPRLFDGFLSTRPLSYTDPNAILRQAIATTAHRTVT